MIRIREMEISDYESVFDLWSKTEGLLLREVDSKDNIAKYLSRNGGLSFVAENDSSVVGAVLVGTDGRRGYVQHLAVSKEQRGRGIGRRLIKRAITALEKQGILKTHLFVTNENRFAQAFYKSMGWSLRDEVQMFSFNSSKIENI